MKEIVLSLMVWIGANTDFTESISPPPIVIQTQAELVALVGTDRIPGGASIAGVYDSQTRTLFLDENVDVKTDDGKSTLVHELVHHFQVVTDRHRDGQCLYEAQAYSIEDKWRREHGLIQAIQIPGFVYWIGQCIMRQEYVK